jgi:hypothetical protein
MQTFLPYKSFVYSAMVLDTKRLGKQRVETLQIMKALVTGEGWIHHPVTKMWAGYENSLMSYQYAICEFWTRKGYNDTCLDKTLALFQSLPRERRLPRVPWWQGKKFVHSAHRGNLLRKDPEWYGQFNWPEQPREGYDYPKPRELPVTLEMIRGA